MRNIFLDFHTLFRYRDCVLFSDNNTVPLFAPQYGVPSRASHRGSHQPTRRPRTHSPPSHGSTQNNKKIYCFIIIDTTVSSRRWKPNRAHQGSASQLVLRDGWLPRPPNKLSRRNIPRPEEHEIRPKKRIRTQHTQNTNHALKQHN